VRRYEQGAHFIISWLSGYRLRLKGTIIADILIHVGPKGLTLAELRIDRKGTRGRFVIGAGDPDVLINYAKEKLSRVVFLVGVKECPKGWEYQWRSGWCRYELPVPGAEEQA